MFSNWVRREQEKYAFEYIPEAHLLRCGARKLQMPLAIRYHAAHEHGAIANDGSHVYTSVSIEGRQLTSGTFGSSAFHVPMKS